MTHRIHAFRHRIVAAFAWILLAAIIAPVGLAQQGPAPPAEPARMPADSQPGGFGGLDDFGFGGPGDFGLEDSIPAQEITVSAAFTAAANGQPARLFITADLARNWHLYSITQPPGAVMPTKVKLEPSNDFQLTGDFVPDRPPKVKKTDVFPIPVEEHHDTVTFSAPVRLAAGVDPAQIRISGELQGMVCNDERGCVPLSVIDTKFEARLTAGQEADRLLALVPAEGTGATGDPRAAVQNGSPTAKSGEGFRAPGTHADFWGHFEPETVTPGSTATLVLTATADPSWHVYSFETKSATGDFPTPSTRVVLRQPSDWTLFALQPDSAPTEKREEGLPLIRYHEGTVTWKGKIEIPTDIQPGQYAVEGLIGFQTCSTVCDRPLAATFSTTVRVGPAPVPGEHRLVFAKADESYKEVTLLADAATEQLASIGPDPVTRAPTEPVSENPPTEEQPTAEPAPADVAASDAKPEEPTAAKGFNLDEVSENTSRKLEDFTDAKFWFVVIPAAFMGGLILNIMPCVLPVIGLKIMGFVNQAGESRGRIFALNVWYALGLLSVFLILATPMALLTVSNSDAASDGDWGWGAQFNNDGFNITIIAIVFVMALSFLGVWEIPIPGFASGSTATKLAEKEGPAGAFAKGMITTVLATPCTGPGLAFAMTWCLAMSFTQVYIFFTAIALGMASPYLVIGAFPKLIKSLPKPGAWMETVKQVMGFVLLATIVWLFMSISWTIMVPVLAFMFALWGACWWIGRTPITAERPVKARAWIGAAVFAALIGLFAFSEGITVGGYPIPGLAGVMQHRFDSVVQGKVETRIAEEKEKVLELALKAIAAADPNASSTGAGQDVTADARLTVDENGGENATPKNDFELPWQRFSLAKLEQLTAENKTVMIDFTADWCATCKTLKQFVLNTRDVREVVDRNDVITLLGNWSNNDDVGKMLSALNSRQVPVLAIFPAGEPNNPIVISGPYSKSTLISKLEEAGPSMAAPDEPRAAMRIP